MEPLAWYRIAFPAAACAGLLVLAAVRPVPRLRFAALGLIALVGYGAAQDQVSARLCPEYFTVFHPPVPGLTDPTLLGAAWGFLGAWWGGVLMGYSLGLTATLGPRPPLPLRRAVRPVLAVLAVTGVATALTGVSVWRHAELFGVGLDAGTARLLPPERHRPLLVVACYHFVAYATAVLGSVALCLWAANERRKAAAVSSAEPPAARPQC